MTTHFFCPMLHIVISPAKSLNLDHNYPATSLTTPIFLPQAEVVNAVMKKKSKKQLMKLQGISDKLAEENYLRNQNWNLEEHRTGKPAIYLFDGEVYTGLDALTLSPEVLERAKSQLHILSGLYGLLSPTDGIMPYRLEMGTSLIVARKKSLYAYWTKQVTNHLNEVLDGPLVNLASQEYFKAIDTKVLKQPVIDVEFKEVKNGQAKVLSFFAKKARGTMARYILENQVKDRDSLCLFDRDGYQFMEQYSTNEKLVFYRG